VQRRKISRCEAYDSLYVDVKLIASTGANSTEDHNDVWEELRRLGAVQLRIPPLRDREEIAAFASFFLERLNPGRHREVRLQPEVLDGHRADAWPGNLRQLEERCCAPQWPTGARRPRESELFRALIDCAGLVGPVC